MTYYAQPQVEIGYFNFSFTGTLATNDYVNINAENNMITGSSITSSNTLNLPAGDYLIKAFVGGNRTLSDDVLEFQVESDGSLIDVIGSNLTYETVGAQYETTSDHAYAQISKTSASELKIKITTCTASSWTVDADYCYLLVIRGF